MAPSTSKANYKSYEAQARMIRAIVAAHPDVKWNYKGKHIRDYLLEASSSSSSSPAHLSFIIHL